MSPSARTHEHRWWILAVLCLSVLLVAMDNTIVNVALAFLPQRDAVSGRQPAPRPAPAPRERPEPAVVAAVER